MLLKAPAQFSWCWCNRNRGASRWRRLRHPQTWRTCGVCLKWRENKTSSVLQVSSLRAKIVKLSALTNFHGKAHAHVDVFCPDIVGGFGVEHRVDAAVQVGLAGCLTTTGQSNDGGTGSVPWQHVSRPAENKWRCYTILQNLSVFLPNGSI